MAYTTNGATCKYFMFLEGEQLMADNKHRLIFALLDFLYSIFLYIFLSIAPSLNVTCIYSYKRTEQLSLLHGDL